MMRKAGDLLTCVLDTPENLDSIKRLVAMRDYSRENVALIRRGVMLQLRAKRDFNDG